MTKLEYLRRTNHVWVLAEIAPFEIVAVEAAGGYLVFKEKYDIPDIIMNDQYFIGMEFENPRKFKKFQEVRNSYFKSCGELDEMIEAWNRQYAGGYKTYDSAKYKGMMDQKEEECKKATYEVFVFFD